MAESRPEIRSWLVEQGYTSEQVEKILTELDHYDEHTNRESLFEDMASGVFDIGPIIEAALKEGES